MKQHRSTNVDSMRTITLARNSTLSLTHACIVQSRLVAVFSTPVEDENVLALFDTSDGTQLHSVTTPHVSACISVGANQFLVCHTTGMCVYTVDALQTTFSQTASVHLVQPLFRQACVIAKNVVATGTYDNVIQSWIIKGSDIVLCGSADAPKGSGVAQYTKAMTAFPKHVGRFVSGHTGAPPNLFVWQHASDCVKMERQIDCLGQTAVLDVASISSDVVVVCTTKAVFTIHVQPTTTTVLSRHTVNNVQPMSWRCIYIERPTYYAFYLQYNKTPQTFGAGNFLHIESTNRRAKAVHPVECPIESVQALLYSLNHVITCSTDGHVRFYQLPDSVNPSWQSTLFRMHMLRNNAFGNLPEDVVREIYKLLLI